MEEQMLDNYNMQIMQESAKLFTSLSPKHSRIPVLFAQCMQDVFRIGEVS